jgi:hypothetical protein
LMPFRYLVSGGVSMRALMPRAATPVWRAVERALGPWMRHWAMFALVVLRKAGVDAEAASLRSRLSILGTDVEGARELAD